jgi:hypothetical protein
LQLHLHSFFKVSKKQLGGEDQSTIGKAPLKKINLLIEESIRFTRERLSVQIPYHFFYFLQIINVYKGKMITSIQRKK